MDGAAQVLFVEGPDDKHVVCHLTGRHDDMPEFCISDKEGRSNLLEDIGAELRKPGRRAIGILVDANDNLDGRWKAVAGRLREESIEVPDNPETGGTIVDGTPSHWHLVDA